MIIKLIGSIMVVSSCAASGCIMSRKSRYRIEDIEEMKKAVSFYKGSVCAMGLSAGEAFRETALRIKGAVKSIFEDAAEQTEKREFSDIQQIWKNAVDKNVPSLFLNSEDMETLYSFGAIAGFMDRQQQRENAELIISELERIQKKAGEKCAREERLFPSAGALCGMLLCILLF